MTESATGFFLGILAAVGLVLLTIQASNAIRWRFMPGWTGPAGILVVTVLAVGLVTVEATFLGLVGILAWWSLLLLAALIAGAVSIRPGLPRRDSDPAPPGPPPPRWGRALVIAVVFLTVGQWASFASYSLDFGMTNFDSVWYHLPISAEFARTGSILSPFRPETVFLNWFYPLNSELLHSVGMSLTGRDFLSLWMNMGWMGLALLAGWVVGRPWGRSHLTLVAVAVVISAHVLVVREPGSAKNDIQAIALLISAVALLVNSGPGIGKTPGRLLPGPAVALAGLALGLAAGTKVTALAPAFFILIAIGAAAVSGRRIRVLATAFVPALVGGGFWFLRNLVVTGNPLPQIRQLGPFDLPGPERLQQGRPDFTVVHYITDGSVWSDYFLPGLDRALGPLWPLLLVVFLVGTVALILTGRGRLVRLLAGAALLSGAAYLFTPLSAAGSEGMPTAFAINLRFLSPALALGLVLIPTLPVLAARKARIGAALMLVVLFLFGTRPDALVTESGRLFGLAFAIVVVLVPLLVRSFGRRLPVAGGRLGTAGWMVAAPLAVALVLSWPLASHYFDSRYRDFEPEIGMAQPYRWANMTSGARIALAGTTAGFRGYGFFGPDLSNEVSYLGLDAPAGGFDAIRDCRTFRRTLNRAAPDYLVTSPLFEFERPEVPGPSRERAWIARSRSLERVAGSRKVEVWSVTAPLPPTGCS